MRSPASSAVSRTIRRSGSLPCSAAGDGRETRWGSFRHRHQNCIIGGGRSRSARRRSPRLRAGNRRGGCAPVCRCRSGQVEMINSMPAGNEQGPEPAQPRHPVLQDRPRQPGNDQVAPAGITTLSCFSHQSHVDSGWWPGWPSRPRSRAAAARAAAWRGRPPGSPSPGRPRRAGPAQSDRSSFRRFPRGLGRLAPSRCTEAVSLQPRFAPLLPFSSLLIARGWTTEAP